MRIQHPLKKKKGLRRLSSRAPSPLCQLWGTTPDEGMGRGGSVSVWFGFSLQLEPVLSDSRPGNPKPWGQPSRDQ